MTVTLAPLPGQTLTVSGVITDQTASGGTGANTGGEALLLNGAGTVGLSATDTYTGGTTLSGGGTLERANTGSVIYSGVAFGGDGTLQFDALASRVHDISGDNTSSQSLFFAGVSPGGVTLVNNGPGSATVDGMAVTGSFASLSAASVNGGTRPIIWIGRHTVNVAAHARPECIAPIVVAAHAFGPSLPSRMLRLSPEHAVFAEGALIPVGQLVNGTTIRGEQVAVVTWWHVELDHHDVILAEDLPVESYLENGNRADFERADVMTLQPALRGREGARACAPIRRRGRRSKRSGRAFRQQLRLVSLLEAKPDCLIGR